MQLLLWAILFSAAAKGNPNSGPLGNEYDSLPFSDDTCIANFFYHELGNGRYIFYDSLSFYKEDATVEWIIENDTFSNVHSVNYTFPEDATSANVCLSITTAGFNICTSCWSFPIIRDSSEYYCIADFDYALSDTVFEGFSRVNFTNSSIGSHQIQSSQWYFGDGGNSQEMNPYHDYMNSNDSLWMVALFITTSSGCRDSVFRYVNITPADTSSHYCSADFNHSIISTDSTNRVTSIQFINSSESSDPITTSYWNLGDGAYSTEMNPVHEFYTTMDTMLPVSLFITTSSGCTDSVFHNVFIPVSSDTGAYSCKADFNFDLVISADSTGKALFTVNFNNTSSGIYLSNLWSFGDNTYSDAHNPSHTYQYPQETSVIVTLTVTAPMGCYNATAKQIIFPGVEKLYSLSGIVTGKNEPLPQGTLVLYKKNDYGYFEITDANVINNGFFGFTGLKEGKYLLYAMPHMYYSGEFLPTYYVNKLQWFKADAIDLKSNIGEITLELKSTRYLGWGPGKISGKINWNSRGNESAGILKSTDFETKALVYLYTESGEVIDVCAPDEFNNFAFDDLLYGTYTIMLESVNLPENKTTVTLSTDIPNATELEFNVDGYSVGISKPISENTFLVYSISDEEIGIQIGVEGSYKVTVFDISGIRIFETTEDFDASVEKIISIGSIPKGIYLIKIQNDTSAISRKITR